MSLDSNVFKDIWELADLDDDLRALCDCGGRLAGSVGEYQSRDFLIDRLNQIAAPVTQDKWEFDGWRPGEASIEMVDSPHVQLESVPLVMSPPTPTDGLELELIDLGRGTPEDFEAAGERIKSRAVLVQHEFPFSTGHVHRREKYLLSRQMGAAAFIIANNVPDIGPVTGGTGEGIAEDIPSIGLSREAGEQLRQAAAAKDLVVRIRVDSKQESWQPCNISAEIPGASDEWIVLCAHYDGHDLAESAMDNGSGVVVALEAARRLAPLAKQFSFGLRVMFFTVEEWGLQGSKRYVHNLSEEERAKIAMVINLDTVVGHERLCALTSGLEDVETFVKKVSVSNGTPISIIRPTLANSDHFNFVQAGIPALRLIAGYEEPVNSNTRYLLTPGDTRSRIEPGQLRVAAFTVARLVWEACTADTRPARYRGAQPTSAAATKTGW